MKKVMFILWVLGCVFMPVEVKAVDLKATEALIQSSNYLSSAWKERLIISLKNAYDQGFPASEAQMIISKSLTNKIAPGTINGFMGLALEAYRQQLPLEPILNKIKEGLAKGVAGEMVQRVATEVTMQLRAGKEMVEQVLQKGVKVSDLREKERLIAAITLAQARGMNLKDLQQIIQTPLSHRTTDMITASQLESAVNTAATLTGMGIPTSLGLETVITALEHHYTAPEWNRLEALAGKFKQQGIPYQNLIKLMKSGFTAGQTPADTLQKIDTHMQHMGTRGPGPSPEQPGGSSTGPGRGGSVPGGNRPGMGGMGSMGSQRHR